MTACLITLLGFVVPAVTVAGGAEREAQALAGRIASLRACSTSRASTPAGKEYKVTTCSYDYKGLKLSLTLKSEVTPAEFNVTAVPASKLSLHFVAGDPTLSCYAEINEWQRAAKGPVKVTTVYVDSRSGDVFALGDQPSCTEQQR